jgi:hypothetical protein
MWWLTWKVGPSRDVSENLVYLPGHVSPAKPFYLTVETGWGAGMNVRTIQWKRSRAIQFISLLLLLSTPSHYLALYYAALH